MIAYELHMKYISVAVKCNKKIFTYLRLKSTRRNTS